MAKFLPQPEGRLIELVRATPWFFDALLAVRGLGLGSWCIGAGAVRNLVWDALHHAASPSHLEDVDVAYFDPSNISPERDVLLQSQLSVSHPSIPWEVTNQAGVHRWFEGFFGHPVNPLSSLEEAVASWPEYATCVGITLDDREVLRVIAPHGLEDLFSIIVRHNPARTSPDTYRRRVAQKRYPERWPKVRIVL